DAKEGDAHGMEAAEGYAALVGGGDGLDVGAEGRAQAMDAGSDAGLRAYRREEEDHGGPPPPSGAPHPQERSHRGAAPESAGEDATKEETGEGARREDSEGGRSDDDREEQRGADPEPGEERQAGLHRLVSGAAAARAR